MNSPFSQLFVALQARIHNNLEAIVYTDQDLGQLKAPARPPVAFPCVLIDLELFHFQNLSGNAQTATGTVVIKLVHAPYSPSAQNTPEPALTRALTYYETEWNLHLCLQGWSAGAAFGSLNRTSAATLPNKDKLRIRELRYALSFDDFSAASAPHITNATAAVTETVEL
jgi:hypothetical protein